MTFIYVYINGKEFLYILWFYTKRKEALFVVSINARINVEKF